MGNTLDSENKVRFRQAYDMQGTIEFDRSVDNQLKLSGTEIESNVRIPQSALWRLQHQFYSSVSSRHWKYRQLALNSSSSTYLAQVLFLRTVDS